MIALFKKKESHQRSDPIACCGKLASYPEFINLHQNNSVFIQIDQWFQSAYRYFVKQYGERAKVLLEKMSNYHCLRFDKRIEKPILISVFSSSDQGGRYYPFVISRILEHSMAKEFMTSIPLLYYDYIMTSEEFFKTVSTDSSLTNIHEKLLQYSKIDLKGSRLEILKKAYQLLSSKESTNEKEIQSIRLNSGQGIHLLISQNENQLVKVSSCLQFFEKRKILQENNWEMYWQTGNQYYSPSMFLFHQTLDEKEWSILINTDWENNEG